MRSARFIPFLLLSTIGIGTPAVAFDLTRRLQATTEMQAVCINRNTSIVQGLQDVPQAMPQGRARSASDERQCARHLKRLCRFCDRGNRLLPLCVPCTEQAEACRLTDDPRSFIPLEEQLEVAVTLRTPDVSAIPCTVRVTRAGDELFIGDCERLPKLPATVAGGRIFLVPVGAVDRSTNNLVRVEGTYGSLRGYIAVSQRVINGSQLATAEDILGVRMHVLYGSEFSLTRDLIGVSAPWRVDAFSALGRSCILTGELVAGEVPLRY